MSTSEVSREVLAAARRLAERRELGRASMAEIAAEAGITRVTLYRRGETRESILAALRAELVAEESERVIPIVVGPGTVRERLHAVLVALCELTESRIDLLSGLDDPVLNSLYHEPGADSLTRAEFLDPIVRLLEDGVIDGSLRSWPKPREVATALYTQVTYTFTHLCSEHGWDRDKATSYVVELAEGGLVAASPRM